MIYKIHSSPTFKTRNIISAIPFHLDFPVENVHGTVLSNEYLWDIIAAEQCQCISSKDKNFIKFIPAFWSQVSPSKNMNSKREKKQAHSQHSSLVISSSSPYQEYKHTYTSTDFHPLFSPSSFSFREEEKDSERNSVRVATRFLSSVDPIEVQILRTNTHTREHMNKDLKSSSRIIHTTITHT